MNILVSGLVNVETSVRVRGFPIAYFPIDYPFFGVQSVVGGVEVNRAHNARVVNQHIQRGKIRRHLFIKRAD